MVKSLATVTVPLPVEPTLVNPLIVVILGWAACNTVPSRLPLTFLSDDKLIFWVASISPPTINFLATPRPPDTTVPAVVVEVASVSLESVVTPETPNVPPKDVAPVPTVKVLASATVTSSFKAVVPVTARLPPKDVAPVPTVKVLELLIEVLPARVTLPLPVVNVPLPEAIVKFLLAATVTLSFKAVVP